MFHNILNGCDYINFDDKEYPNNVLHSPATWYSFDRQRIIYNKGTELLQGGWYVKADDSEPAQYLGEYTDGSATVLCEFHDEDPILQFKANITNVATGEVSTQYYESTMALRMGVGYLMTGNNLEEYNKADAVNIWLARSWIEGTNTEEIYFLVESKDMLDEVAEYYNLPVPYDAARERMLTDNLKSIRFKSYDLNHEGEGNYVAVVVAGIELTNGVATSFKLYETTRGE